VLTRLWSRRRTVIAASVAGVAVLAGVGVLVARTVGGDQSTAAPNVALNVEQYRDDEVAHAIQIAVRNHEPGPIAVEDVRFDSPDFMPTGRVGYEGEPVPPGGLQIDFKTPYGKGRCDGATVPAHAGPATAVLRIQSADGTADDYRYPLADPQGLLDRLLAADCRQVLVANVADISFGDTWTVTRGGSQPVLHGTVELHRTNLDRSVAVTDLLGSVLFEIHKPRQAPLATLPKGATQASFPIAVTTPRCTGHAFGESKQTYYFRVWVSIDGAEPVGVTFVPDAHAKDALHGLQQLCPPEE
jgi:hypothetical protein